MGILEVTSSYKFLEGLIIRLNYLICIKNLRLLLKIRNITLVKYDDQSSKVHGLIIWESSSGHTCSYTTRFIRVFSTHVHACAPKSKSLQTLSAPILKSRKFLWKFLSETRINFMKNYAYSWLVLLKKKACRNFSTFFHKIFSVLKLTSCFESTDDF